MALLPRSSLRSGRRTPDHSDDDGLPPPTKKQRVQQENGPHRRRSSPDCLDITTPDPRPSAGKARYANPPLKATRPRTSTRRTRGLSDSSVDTVASAIQLVTPANTRVNAAGLVKPLRVRPDRSTPSATDHLRDLRESPDPLDTISPIATTATIKLRPEVCTTTAIAENSPARSPVSTPITRHNNPELKTDTAGTDLESNESTLAQPMEPPPVKVTRSQQKHVNDPVENERPELKATERRSLRSADSGSRSKSELAQYFYNYEQLISLDDPHPESLTGATTVTLVNDLSEPLPPLSTSNGTPFGNPLQNLWDCEVITLPDPPPNTSALDPLNDELYFRAHRKFERQEKQLRNIERDRAQHEKQQIERLLDELRGYDWLRVMGLYGVHESEKKLYEPKRQILIEELVALLNKFQVWKDEERRRKQGKDKPLPTADRESSAQRVRPTEDTEDVEISSVPGAETLSTPDPNDVDAWAARQLHQEARSASAAKRRKSVSSARKPTIAANDVNGSQANKNNIKRQKTHHESPPAPSPHIPAQHLPPPPPPPDKPFVSFFADPHLRDMAIAALTGNRRGRSHTILAFGLPIPEMDEREFQPPAELLTDEAIRASQRQRRRLKRHSQG